MAEIEAATPDTAATSEPQGEPDNSSVAANSSDYHPASNNSGLGRSGPYDHVGRQGTANFYVDSEEMLKSAGSPVDDNMTFVAEDGEANFDPSTWSFYMKKKRPDEEINVSRLPEKAQALFLGKGGSREKEIKAILVPDSEGTRAIRIYRGHEARELKRKYEHRIVPSRWHEKWKDMGDGFDNELNDPNVPKHMSAKSRWILQGFHDPDIHLLNRTVPTPATEDVPLTLQLLASLLARAFCADVRSAFSQGIRGQRPDRLFASPPPRGFPGEEDDILVEILAEVYGLVSGPPGWRKSLFTDFRT